MSNVEEGAIRTIAMHKEKPEAMEKQSTALR